MNDLCKQVLEILKEEEKVLFDLNQGFFYKIILTLFCENFDFEKDEDSDFLKEKSERIEIVEAKINNLYVHFGIEKDQSINEDYKKALEIYKKALGIIEDGDESSLNRGRIPKIFSNVSQGIADILRDNAQGIVPGDDSSTKEEKMELIIVVASILVVGTYFCIRYIEYIEKKKERSRSLSSLTHQAPQEERPLGVYLCLVVPANETMGLFDKDSIQVSELKKLIDVSSYFLCDKIEVIRKNEPLLKKMPKMPEEPITQDSHREFYVKVFINDGKDMIGAKTRYSLKENLKDTARCIIEEIAYLKSLSGLESFVRI